MFINLFGFCAFSMISGWMLLGGVRKRETESREREN